MNYLITIKKRYKIIAIVLMLMTITAVSSAYVYETGQSQVTQTIINIADLTATNSALGNIEEGQTITYNSTGTQTPDFQVVSSLGGIVSLTTTKDNVYLNFASSDLAALTTYYSTYQIDVKFAAVPTGSTSTVVGAVACTMNIGAPTPASVTLDKAGTYTFDFEITTTANTAITADHVTTVTVTVIAQSA